MKLICGKETLLHYINIVNKAVTAKSTMQILECILLSVDEKGFTMTANNLEIGIQTAPIDAQILETGEVAIEARIFQDIVRRLNGENVTLESDARHSITITDGSSCFTIMGQNGEDFPTLPEVQQNEAFTLGQNELRNLIRQTIFSIAQESAKQVLMGEYFEMKADALQVVSIDGYRISFCKSPVSHAFQEKSVIVPGKTLNELMKILSQEEEDKVHLYFTDKHVLFDLGMATMVSRLIEGEFISYENNFTNDFTTKIIIETQALIQALERASLVSRDNRKTPVKLEMRPNQLILTAKSDMGSAYEEVPDETEGDEMQIAFNPRYLIEALRAIEDEKVAIRFTGSLSPCIIAPLEGDAYQYLILPLRI